MPTTVQLISPLVTHPSYDQKIHGNDIEVGDRVLLRNLSERGGTGKLRSHWEDTVYVVTKKAENIPVFDIKPLNGKNTKSKRVHRNIIMPCSQLPVEKVNKKISKTSKNEKVISDKSQFVEDSDSDNDYVIVYPKVINSEKTKIHHLEGENSYRTSMDQEQLIDQTDQNENDTNSDNDSHDFIPRRSNRIRKKHKKI